MSRPRSFAAVAAIALAAALGLAACSGGAGGSAAPTTAPASEAPSDAPASDAPTSAAACGAATGTATVEVTIEGFAFDPGTVAASVGDVIGFTNRDGAPHTVTLDDDACTTGSITRDAQAALTFNAPGSYPFHCRIHPDMTGTFEISGSAAAAPGY